MPQHRAELRERLADGDIDEKNKLMPYFLPKPYLLITKNMTHLQTQAPADTPKDSKAKGESPKATGAPPEASIRRSP